MPIHTPNSLETPDEGQQHQRQRNAVAAEEAGDGLDERLGDIDAALHGGGRTLRFGAQQRGDDRQQHQCRHGQIGHDPAFELGQVQRAGTGQDQADPVTQRIGGRQRGLRRLRRESAHAGEHGHWLLFGERQRAHDLLFADEIEAWQAQGHLARVDLAFSRDGGAWRGDPRLRLAAGHGRRRGPGAARCTGR
ncbi:hypothetical protein G6F46_013723 [Rhizopus delemar]|nr:hypothetical protein G6F46_013723 [Rhizopus delemar]